jgi:hypothetical protein
MPREACLGVFLGGMYLQNIYNNIRLKMKKEKEKEMKHEMGCHVMAHPDHQPLSPQMLP